MILQKLVLGQMFKSKKFWYAISSIVVPIICNTLGMDEETATKMFYSLLTLVLGQGIADSGKK
jgi:hypothetical protein|tara:strand:- start:2183 stop:2371 length:189 start_codon:yes stop_codon:yes gene_type:complete